MPESDEQVKVWPILWLLLGFAAGQTALYWATPPPLEPWFAVNGPIIMLEDDGSIAWTEGDIQALQIWDGVQLDVADRALRSPRCTIGRDRLLCDVPLDVGWAVANRASQLHIRESDAPYPPFAKGLDGQSVAESGSSLDFRQNATFHPRF